MAVSFGYEVRHMYFFHPNSFQHSGQGFTGLILGIKRCFPVWFTVTRSSFVKSATLLEHCNCVSGDSL